ncbi:MAG: hypothetical protein ACI9T8_000314 [Candidatus Saccharimonadales bacterium]|jgi:hypothetical protein
MGPDIRRYTSPETKPPVIHAKLLSGESVFFVLNQFANTRNRDRDPMARGLRASPDLAAERARLFREAAQGQPTYGTIDRGLVQQW